MSVSDLKSAATGPHRFLSIFESQTQTGSEVKAADTRTLHLEPQFHIGMNDRFFLVPGGRYLVTTSGDNLYLWDLSSTHEYPQPLSNIVAASSASYNYYSSDIYPTGDGQGLRILISRRLDNSNFHFIIYDIYPLSPTPTFVKVAELETPYGFGVKEYYLHNDYLVMLVDRPKLTVWDFVKNMSINITHDVLDIIDPIKPFVYNDLLITISSAEICIWTMPELVPGHEAVTEENAVHHDPCKIIDIRRQYFTDEPAFVGPSAWYLNDHRLRSRPMMFEWAYYSVGPCEMGGTRHELDFEVLQKSIVSDISDNEIVPGRNFYHGMTTIEVFRYRPCNSKLVSLVVDEDDEDEYNQHYRRAAVEADVDVANWEPKSLLNLYLSTPYLSNSNRGWDGYTLLKGFNTSDNIKHVSVCPFSGRVCLANNNTDDRRMADILVMNYLQ